SLVGRWTLDKGPMPGEGGISSDHSMLGWLCVVDMTVAIDGAGSRVGRPDRPSAGVQHGRGAEGFAQVAGGSRLLDTLDGRDVVMGRDEDDRDGQSSLEVESIHIIHVDVEHEARRFIPRQPVEELAGGRERLALVAGGLHDAKERATDRRVVVHDRNYWYILHDIVHAESPLVITLSCVPA